MRLGKSSVVVPLLCLMLVACGGDRPAASEWRATWEAVTAGIPELSIVTEDGPDAAVCETTLAYLRSNRAELLPSPDLAIDDAVNSWFEIAEDAFFECPPESAQMSSFSDAYAELGVLEAEIEIVLQLRAGA